MQQMTDSIAREIPREGCRLSSRVEAVGHQSSKWLLITAGPRTEEFEGVIVATPAPRASELMAQASPELAFELNGFRYSSSVIVVLGYGREVRARLPEGFGLLVPRRENCRLLAVTFVHNKFPERAPPDRALLRCFLGGSRDEEVLEWSEDEIQFQVRRELVRILPLREEPRFVRIYKWRQSTAIYGVGHLLRVERIHGIVSTLGGLALAGNAYGGIGVPDCVRSGREAASKVLADLGIPCS
jgi:oxygen-dependent protoporphyrinogen oxidase